MMVQALSLVLFAVFVVVSLILAQMWTGEDIPESDEVARFRELEE